MRCSEYRELVAAHADNVLDASESEQADRHTEVCPACDLLRMAQRDVSALVRRLSPDMTSALLQRRVVRETMGSRRSRPATRAWTRVLVAGSVAAALILGIVSTLRNTEPTIIATLLADVEAVSASPLSLPVQTSNPQQLRNYYARNGLSFADTVENFEAGGLELVGGGVSSIGDALTTRTVYQSGDDSRVVCRRYLAGEVEWPRGGQRIGNSEVFDHGGVNIALTRIGDVVCAMASKMPREHFMSAVHVAHR